MRISDWSSDVCSSDLALGRTATRRASGLAPLRIGLDRRTGAHERHVFGQYHRQLLLRHRHIAADRAQDHRNRATPVTLAADAPVAQAEIDPALAVLAAQFGHLVESDAVIEAIDGTRVHPPPLRMRSAARREGKEGE